MNDDDFLTRLRATAHDAVPPSGLDLAVVLRSSRRRARTRRATTAVASVAALAVLGAGVSSAVTNPQVVGLFEPAAYETQVAEPTTAEIAPGIVAAVEPATYVLDDGTTVLDTGLDAWGEDERVLAVVGFHTDVGNAYHPASTRFVLGGDDDLEALLRGEEAGVVLDLPRSTREGTVLTRPDRDDALYLGRARSSGDEPPRMEAYLLPWESGDADPTDPEVVELAVALGDEPEPWGFVAAELRGLTDDRFQGLIFHTGNLRGALLCGPGQCAVGFDPGTGQVIDLQTGEPHEGDWPTFDPRGTLTALGERWSAPGGVAAKLRALELAGDDVPAGDDPERELRDLCLAERDVDAPDSYFGYWQGGELSDREQRVRIRCELDVHSETTWRYVQEELAVQEELTDAG